MPDTYPISGNINVTTLVKFGSFTHQARAIMEEAVVPTTTTKPFKGIGRSHVYESTPLDTKKLTECFRFVYCNSTEYQIFHRVKFL